MENFKTVLSGANSTYLLALLEQYNNDPDSVSQDWRPVLQEMIAEYGMTETRPTWGDSLSKTDDYVVSTLPDAKDAGSISDVKSFHDIQLTIKVQSLIQAYRFKGHLNANLDPLGMHKQKKDPELSPAYYGISEEDYNKSIYVNGAFGAKTLLLSELLTKLKNTYCHHISTEYMHITNHEVRLWVQNRVEQNQFRAGLSLKQKILKQLTEAEFFERFIHKKFPGAKRFGLDGGEILIAALKELVNLKTKEGVKKIYFWYGSSG